jgi:class 3 adenylate cyclase/TolB-like protein/Flp pilus assembly protein TadD
MQQTATQRRLAAILAADVVGFSRMMGADEEGTHERLKKIREEVTDPAVAEFRGRIFKTTGDGILAEFPSVVDAVQCSAKVQVEMARRNAAAPAEQRIVFRIGINLGDVIVEGDDLYGDGVNVAARLEGICDPGGVAVSASAYDQVRGKVDVKFADRGEHKVKNIARPVRIYAVDLRSHGVAFKRRRAFPFRPFPVLVVLVAIAALLFTYFSSKKPKESAAATIAVLPFANQSGDAKRDYFSDGITEDIINALGRFSGVRVSARNAVQPYKGKSPTPGEVSRDLGVRYLVQGSVREAGGRVRVGVELSDAMKGTLLWSERYEGEGKEVFEIQDRIVRDIAGALAGRLTALESQRITSKPPESMEAYDLVLRARELVGRFERTSNREARALAAQAIQLSPGYAEAYAVLAEAEYFRAVSGWVEDPAEALRRSEEAATRALALGDPGASARAHGTLGSVYTFDGRFDAALAEAERAIELNPSDARAHALRSGVLLWLGRMGEAIASGEASRRYDPQMSSDAGFNLSFAYYLAGRYREAAATADAAALRTPDIVFLEAVRAAAHAQAGQKDEALRAAQNVRRADPFFKVELFGRRLVNPAHQKLAQEGLRKAGL